jgi:hypothetical protein
MGLIRICREDDFEGDLSRMIDKVLFRRMIKYANKETHKDGVIKMFPGYLVTVLATNTAGKITAIDVRRAL